MEWLIDALREPAAELLNLVGLALLALVTQRVRARGKRVEAAVAANGHPPAVPPPRARRRSKSSSNTPAQTRSLRRARQGRERLLPLHPSDPSSE
jgi:hypothetical protein